MNYEIDFANCISSETNIEHKKFVNVILFFSNGNAEFEILRLLREERGKIKKPFAQNLSNQNGVKISPLVVSLIRKLPFH